MNKGLITAVIATMILVGFGGFFLGVKEKEKTTSLNPTPTVLIQTPLATPAETANPSARPSQTITLPVQVALNYFTMFVACTKNPPAAAKGQVTVYCEDHNDYAGSLLAGNLAIQANKGYIPVTCAQNLPQDISPTGTPIISKTKATVVLRELYGAGKTVTVTYQLGIEDGEWKVQSIICP